MVGYLALLPMFSVIKDVCKVTRASPQNSYSEMSHWNAAAATVLHGAGLISSPQRVRLISPTEGLHNVTDQSGKTKKKSCLWSRLQLISDWAAHSWRGPQRHTLTIFESIAFWDFCVHWAGALHKPVVKNPLAPSEDGLHMSPIQDIYRYPIYRIRVGIV